MAAVDPERNRRLRDVMEREGTGPSIWRERDCITLIQAVIRELSGQEPVFGLPAWAEGLSEQKAIRRAAREHGTLRQCWLDLLAAEPLLIPVSAGGASAPGRIGLTPVKAFTLDRSTAPTRGPLIGVVGPDCALWIRTHQGLCRAHPAAAFWEVSCLS